MEQPAPEESGNEESGNDDFDPDDIDWDAQPSLLRRLRDAVASAWRRLLVLLRLRPREKSPIEKLCYLIVLNAYAKQARWIEVGLRPDTEDSIADVTYGVDGESLREMTPPRKLLEPIADFFEAWCSVLEDFAGAPTYRGTVTLALGNGAMIRVRVSVRRPEGAPSTVFLELYEASPREDDDDAVGDGESRHVTGFGSA